MRRVRAAQFREPTRCMNGDSCIPLNVCLSANRSTRIRNPASRLLCPLVDDGAPPAHSACREEAPFTYSPQVARFARPGAAAEGAAARAAAPSEAKVRARVEASAGSSGAASAGLAAVNGASGTAAATEPVSSAPPSRVAGASSSSHSLRSGDRHDSPPRVCHHRAGGRRVRDRGSLLNRRAAYASRGAPPAACRPGGRRRFPASKQESLKKMRIVKNRIISIASS